jgi:hypothetical protein
MSASQRRKGAAGERAIANELKKTFPEARRGIGQSRAGGEVPDVDGVPGIWIEVKHRKVATTSTILDALTQASIATDDRLPVVVVKSDREHPIVCMRIGDFADLVNRATFGAEAIDLLRRSRLSSCLPMGCIHDDGGPLVAHVDGCEVYRFQPPANDPAPTENQSAQVIDLMAALKDSLK